MFQGFSEETFEFLSGIRENNNKEWFEKHKNIYTEKVQTPLRELSEEIFKPFESTGMIYKAGRIYRDANFPPFLHYRDILWIYIRYDALYWNKTPSLFFEISPEGAEYGFSIPKPDAAVMEFFRNDLTENSADFLDIIKKIKRKNIKVSGDEYKRPKPCTVPEAKEFFMKKCLSASVKIPKDKISGNISLPKDIVRIFKAVSPLNEYFHNIVQTVENKKANPVIEEENTVKAPVDEFMW